MPGPPLPPELRALGLFTPRQLLRAVAVVGGAALGTWIVGSTFGSLLIEGGCCHGKHGGPGLGRCGDPHLALLFYGTVGSFTALLSWRLLDRWTTAGTATPRRLAEAAGAGFLCGFASSVVYFSLELGILQPPDGTWSPERLATGLAVGGLLGMVLAGPFGAMAGLGHGFIYGAILDGVARARGVLTAERTAAVAAGWLLFLSLGPVYQPPCGLSPGVGGATAAAALALASTALVARLTAMRWLKRVATGRVPGWSLAAAKPGTATDGIPALLGTPFGGELGPSWVLSRAPDAAAPFRGAARDRPVARVPAHLAPGVDDLLLLLVAVESAAVALHALGRCAG